MTSPGTIRFSRGFTPPARRGLVGFLILLLSTSSVLAHPVPQKRHDRTIRVRLTVDAVLVEYRLEADPWTVVNEDVPAVVERSVWSTLLTPAQWYETFVSTHAPILGDGLVATLDGTPLSFRCQKSGYELLDHLRCDFLFEAPWRLLPGRQHHLRLYDGTYDREDDMIRLSLANDLPCSLEGKTEPTAALQEKSILDRQPGDERTLRTVSARFGLPAPPAVVPEVATPPAPELKLSVPAAMLASALAGTLILCRMLRRFVRQHT